MNGNKFMRNVKIYYLNSETFKTDGLLSFSEGREFKSEKRLRQFCLGRFLIKHVLCSDYGVEAPEIGIKNEKPYLVNGDVYFSLSHSKNIVMAAFAPFEVGLDIEYMKGRDFDAIYRYLERKSERPDPDNFYRFWTKYEAEIKLQSEPVSWFCTKLTLGRSCGGVPAGVRQCSVDGDFSGGGRGDDRSFLYAEYNDDGGTSGRCGFSSNSDSGSHHCSYGSRIDKNKAVERPVFGTQDEFMISVCAAEGKDGTPVIREVL